MEEIEEIYDDQIDRKTLNFLYSALFPLFSHGKIPEICDFMKQVAHVFRVSSFCFMFGVLEKT